jgi:serine/threonine-protein kinase
MSLTSTTQTLGSPNYMSPEQLRVSRDVDHRTDIWALGVILFELVSGRLPFLAESVTQLTAMVLQDEPPSLATLRPEVPAHLALAVAKCLQKRPEDRFQNIAELSEAIAPFASAEGAQKARDLLSISGRSSHDVVAAPEPSSVRVLGPNSSTNSAWDRTQLYSSASGRRGVIVGVAIAIIAIVGTAGFEVARHHGDKVAGHDAVTTANGATANTASANTASTTTSVTATASTATTVTTAMTAGTATTAGTTTAANTTTTGHVHGVPTGHGKTDPITAHGTPDAGAAPQATTSGTFQLPNVRN